MIRSERSNHCTRKRGSAEHTEVSRGHSKPKGRRTESVGVFSTTEKGGKSAMDAENKKESCLQKDSAEHEGYVRARRSFNRIWKERDSAQPELLEKILHKDNLNRAFKRVKANKGAPGIDGMTVEEAGDYLRKNQKELIERIRRGKYTPDPVRRVGIPKPEGGVRKLGIPTVKDRMFQQAIGQQLMPIYEPLF